MTPRTIISFRLFAFLLTLLLARLRPPFLEEVDGVSVRFALLSGKIPLKHGLTHPRRSQSLKAVKGA